MAIWQSNMKAVWYLYQRSNYQRVGGELVDEPDFKTKAAISDQNRNLLRLLNEGRCFDFDFEPHEHDLLLLRLSKDEDVRLTFNGGKWIFEGSPVVIETWDHWLLKHGKIIPIIS